MRKLMFFSIGFCAACAFGVYWIPAPLLFVIGILLLVLGTGLLLLKRKDWVQIAGVVCIGLAAGQLWFGIYQGFYLNPAKNLDGEILPITMIAEDFSFDSDYGITVDGVTEIGNNRYRVRMYLNQKEPLQPGDKVTGNFRLRYTAPGGSQNPTYHSGNGILLLAYPRGENGVIPAQGTSLRYVPAYLRQYLLGLLCDLFPPDAAPFAKAVLLGDTSALEYETESDLSASGIRHVVAVSGLHVSILFSLVYLISGKRRGLTVAIGIPVLLVFAAMAGFSPSIVRASLMQLLMLFGLLMKKEYDPPTALSFAVLVMLTVNPLTVTSAGFQLSVASVAGIFLFYNRINQWLLAPGRFGRWKKNGVAWKLIAKVSASVSISLSALITTTPLTAWYFGSVSLLSAVTNLLCLWVVTIFFCGTVGACILGAVWLPLGKGAAWLLSWMVRYILWIAKSIAAFPVSVVYTVSPYITAWLLFCYILLVIFLVGKNKRPVIMCCCVTIALSAALLVSWAEPMLDDYRVTVLDVGQGQCVLLQSQGNTYMVDCGGENPYDTADIAAATLLSQGITRLDGLILTHYDDDHVGAAGNLLYRIPAETVILPAVQEAEFWDSSILKHHGGNTVKAEDDLLISWGDTTITVYCGWNAESSNESSLCVLFQRERCAILITGDQSTVGEEILLRTAAIPQLDALVVGHHGAASSTGDALLTATKPKTALISVGANNSYRHPAQSVLERLKNHGCEIRRTDLEGTIVFRG